MTPDSHLPDVWNIFAVGIALLSEFLKWVGVHDAGFGVVFAAVFGTAGLYLKWRQVRAVEKQNEVKNKP